MRVAIYIRVSTFVLYAAMPYYMIEEFDLADDHIVYELSSEFVVSHKLVLRRLQQIYERSLFYA